MSGGEIRYAASEDGLDIAYQVLGDGPVDLVFVSGFITHLDWSWELPHFAWLEQLDGIARVITFDKRGTGLSDRSLGFGSLEERAQDIVAVMDATGSERAYLCGVSEGGPISILFAAAHPDRVSGLVLYGTAPRFGSAEDWPWGLPEDAQRSWLDFVGSRWGSGRVFGTFVQHSPDEEATRRLMARFERNACTPQMAEEIQRLNLEIDVRDVLSAISVPTLVIHARGDPIVRFEAGRYLAGHIDHAQLVALDGEFHASWRAPDVAGLSDAVVRFLADAGAPPRTVDRVLATVLFTDIVSSTERATRMGDAAWRSLLDRHDRVVGSQAERFGGRVIKSTGDGVLATFDGPSRAIGCASALVEELRAHDLAVRAGVHTGEVELRGDDVAGLGVVIASRICDRADAGQILVSRTVKDLLAGSCTDLADAGEHELKGVPERWRLFSVL